MAKKKQVASTEPTVPKDAMAPAKYEPTEEDKIRDGGYDLDSILRAEEIKGDEKKMKYVMAAMGKKEEGFRSIQELKMAYEAKYGAGKKSK